MRGRFLRGRLLLRGHLERDDQVVQSSGFGAAGLTGKSSIRFEGQPRDHFELASKEIRAFQSEIFQTDVRTRIHTVGKKVKEDESYGKRKCGFQTSNELDMRDDLATTTSRRHHTPRTAIHYGQASRRTLRLTTGFHTVKMAEITRPGSSNVCHC